MPLVFRKWCFHLSGRSRLLSFCKVGHAMGLQKLAFPSFWALEAPVFLQSRTCHWSSEIGVSIFLGARGSCLFCKVEHAIDLQKVAFPFFWALHADVLSFCKVEHATGLQKVVFPSFWALEAVVLLHCRTCHWSVFPCFWRPKTFSTSWRELRLCDQM